MTDEEIVAEIEANKLERDHARSKVEVLTERRRKLFAQGHKAGIPWTVLGRAAGITPEAAMRQVRPQR